MLQKALLLIHVIDHIRCISLVNRIHWRHINIRLIFTFITLQYNTCLVQVIYSAKSHNNKSVFSPGCFCANCIKSVCFFPPCVFSNNSQSNEISVYVQGLVQILQSDKERVEEVINDVTGKWSQSAVNYFNTYLKSDILGHAAKWVIQQFPGLYNPF